jgi:hypothetical protein
MITGGEERDPNLRPQKSEPTPQKIAPTVRPTFKARDRKGLLNPNSLIAGDRIRPERSCPESAE